MSFLSAMVCSLTCIPNRDHTDRRDSFAGVMIAAKTPLAAAFLHGAFKARATSKTYLAVAVGLPVLQKRGAASTDEAPGVTLNTAAAATADAATTGAAGRTGSDRGAPDMFECVPVTAPLGLDPCNRFLMAALPQGKPARSIMSPIGYDGKLSVVKVAIETGRKHQIRVHLAHLGWVDDWEVDFSKSMPPDLT